MNLGGNAMTDTVFTRIVNREIPAAIVYEDETIIAFMDAGQVNPGHVIVATKAPFPTILDADEESLVALMRVTRKVAHAVQAAFQPAGLTILQANKPAGWQTVPHLHLHVLPRHENDGCDITWPRKEPGIEALKELAAKIRL
jgi:histidine triad (HIT) family protein